MKTQNNIRYPNYKIFVRFWDTEDQRFYNGVIESWSDNYNTISVIESDKRSKENKTITFLLVETRLIRVIGYECFDCGTHYDDQDDVAKCDCLPGV